MSPYIHRPKRLRGAQPTSITQMDPSLSIREYQPRDHSAYNSLNAEWLYRYNLMEDASATARPNTYSTQTTMSPYIHRPKRLRGAQPTSITQMDPSLSIREYQPRDHSAYNSLNAEWLYRYNLMEDADLRMLAHPDTAILQPGGKLYVVTTPQDDVVATCAVLPLDHSTGLYEIVKLAVAASHRRQGIARALVLHCVAQARAMGAKRLVLESNDQLQAAVALYEAVGFVHVSAAQMPVSAYVTANVFMEMWL
eukprot:TRINITY_DN4358_c0_g1_i1.p1 TRINITY_DN4358_c0_g1~~TRINITY_DN4358_c0_g1_i1.p1  ORF type:complete len:273 (-),score=27.76 TRINITY_DN4358_c0_g1_i1:1094-1849(-)